MMSSEGDMLSMDAMKSLMEPYRPRERSSYLQMEIVTYVDLWERADVVVDFIERVWQTFDPFQARLETLIWSRWKPRHSRARTFALRPTGKKWAETRRLLLEREVARIVMYDWETTHSYDRGAFDPNVYLAVHFGDPWEQARGHLAKTETMFDPREAKQFVVSMSTRPWSGRVSSKIQEKIAGLAQDLFRAVSGACGYVDIGDQEVTFMGVSPYERRLGMTESNTRRLWQDVRGAFWGNLLSALHVSRLGGSQLVRQRAPCYEIISLSSPGLRVTDEDPLYLQMTPTLGTMRPEDYTQMEDFLAPILVSSKGQLGITILDYALVASAGDATRIRQMLAGIVRRAVVLPRGDILVEYNSPDGWPEAYQALEWMGSNTGRGYRAIPQLRSMWWPDDAVVWTLAELISPRPRSGPIFPVILVQPYVLGDGLELEVCFVNSPTRDVEEQLTNLVQEWSILQYDTETGLTKISHHSVPRRKDDSVAWFADLAPVGQDAYFQLVLMLDEFSKTTARLDQVHVGAWSKQ